MSYSCNVLFSSSNGVTYPLGLFSQSSIGRLTETQEQERPQRDALYTHCANVLIISLWHLRKENMNQ